MILAWLEIFRDLGEIDLTDVLKHEWKFEDSQDDCNEWQHEEVGTVQATNINLIKITEELKFRLMPNEGFSNYYCQVVFL